MSTPRGGATPKLPSPQTEVATPKIVPNETPVNSVEIVQTFEQVNEPIATEIKTTETVTTTEISNGDSVQIIETNEIKTEITSEPEPEPQQQQTQQPDANVESTESNNKLVEPENNDIMTGETSLFIIDREEFFK